MRKNTDTGRFGSPFSATDLAARLGRYGFTECSTLQAFILCICGDPPGPPELGYIRLKLRECLSRHDDGSAWFADLREAEMRVSTAYCIVANVQNADGREAEAKN
ncbi:MULTISPECIES: hypothetical protein [Pantoea]|mgnify:CR=1 FL=1|uniref:hypothetical protein n=1 Tax=Pantoea TaxID=53335 RepID=UPI000930B65A|nr:MULTISPECIES: hypothetical protein [Pantoea]MDJ0034047.1 hypothetical protein [Pantoea ananatis]MDJ0043099.1 hypothetical protein [Pantoea ananatis]PQK69780.1 hypothetical protein CG430_22505 [Pantoea ananatis]